MTKYEVSFGTEERSLDSLTLLLEFPDHPRQEVRELKKEVKEAGVARWLKSRCTNKRCWKNEPITRDR